MTNQNFSNFPKVIIFLQPPYERDCQKIKEDLTNLCQNKNLNLIEIIESQDSYDHQALHRLVDLVNSQASNISTFTPITIIINEDMIATPSNTIFWAVIGTLTVMELITVTTFDYDYIDHGGIFLDDSNLNKDFLDIATGYFKTYHALNWHKNYTNRSKHLEQLIPKPILFLPPPHNLTPHGLKNKHLREEIAAYCKKNGLGILKTIKSKGSFDHHSFCELVRRVAVWHNKPVMVIIDQLMLHTSINKIFWAILGTLRTAGLITISAYARVNGEIVLRHLNKHDNRFIHEATIYAKKFEVYERYDLR